MTHTALLLIDVQQSFCHRPYWLPAAAPHFLERLNALIDACAARGVPIVRVFHVEGPTRAENPFAHESGLVRPLEGLRPVDAAFTVVKTRHSALAGTPLAAWLREQRIDRLIVSGIRTEQCCETTTRHASDEGWAVDFVDEATLTFDMVSPAGNPVSATQLHERTQTVLHRRFAEVCGVDEAVARVDRPR